MCSNIWYDGKDVKNMKKMRKIMLQRAEKPIKISKNKKRRLKIEFLMQQEQHEFFRGSFKPIVPLYETNIIVQQDRKQLEL